MTDASSSSKMFQLDTFCFRQFDDPNYTGTQINFDKQEFEDRINQAYANKECELIDGYAPFCKHLILPNFTTTCVNSAKITLENKSALESTYEARTEKELPVLVRWFPASKVPPHVASHLDVILYSKEQIIKENAAMKQETIIESPWGIISVKAQDADHELPMQPITMMRNALGKDEGGSGVPLDRIKYQESVDYWQEHAVIK